LARAGRPACMFRREDGRRQTWHRMRGGGSVQAVQSVRGGAGKIVVAVV
jgi:hypothetical protein